MPNKSIYDVYFGAGKSAGEYESSLRGVSDVWGDIEQSQKMGALKTQRRERGLDTLLAGTELISQVAGGLESKKEFKSALARVGGSMGEGIVGQKVGKGGEDWGGISPFKKLFQKPQWKFGDTATMGREDISIASDMLKYGGKPDYTRFKPKSAAEEVDLQGESARKAHYQSESDRFESMKADSDKMEAEFERRKSAAAPDWEAINKKQLEDIESARESYSKRKGQYDWLKGRGIIKDTPEAQMEGLGSEAAGDMDVKVDIPGIDQYGILGEHASDIDLEDQQRRRRMSVHGQSIINQPMP